MATGLKTKFISYENDSGAAELVTITGAVRIWLEFGVTSAEVWSASQEAAGAKSWQSTYKQTFASGDSIVVDAITNQNNSDFIEETYIELPTTGTIKGYISGQGVDWVVEAA